MVWRKLFVFYRLTALKQKSKVSMAWPVQLLEKAFFGETAASLWKEKGIPAEAGVPWTGFEEKSCSKRLLTEGHEGHSCLLFSVL